MKHKFTLSDRETDLMVAVVSNFLRGTPFTPTAEQRAFLITHLNAIRRRKPGRQPRSSLASVEGKPVVHLEDNHHGQKGIQLTLSG